MTNEKVIEKCKNLLLDLPNITKVEHLESKVSNITTAWSHKAWSPEQIARDIGANFYDGCIEAKLPIDNVKITTDHDQVVVHSPNTKFSLKKLFFLGSSKTGEQGYVGKHGEGFKLSIVSLARISVFDPINISGSDALIITIGNEDLETKLRPLVFNYFKINEQNGTFFIVNTISDELKDAFKKTMLNFFHLKNELVGELLHEHNEIECYKSNTEHGYGFYCGLKRIEIKNIPIIINIKKPYAALEKLTAQDRDRANFGTKLQSTFYNIFCRGGFGYNFNGNDAIYHIISSSKLTWKKGAPLLASISNHSYTRLKKDPRIKKLFGKEYISESKFRYTGAISWSDWYSTKTQGYVLKRDKQLKDKKIMLPSYFASFGVESSLDAFIRKKENTEKRIKNKKTADLSTKENKAIDFLFKASKKINPSFANLFNRDDEDNNLYEVKFRKIFCKELLGELKNNNEYNSKTVYLHKDLFKASFGKIFSTFLHELSHSHGSGDGEREFSDMLTVLLQNSIEKNSIISKYSKEWSRYRV